MREIVYDSESRSFGFTGVGTSSLGGPAAIYGRHVGLREGNAALARGKGFDESLEIAQQKAAQSARDRTGFLAGTAHAVGGGIGGGMIGTAIGGLIGSKNGHGISGSMKGGAIGTAIGSIGMGMYGRYKAKKRAAKYAAQGARAQMLQDVLNKKKAEELKSSQPHTNVK